MARGETHLSRLSQLPALSFVPELTRPLWRVHRNAVLVGLSQRARFWWALARAAFGLSAYITYRLTRPKITLVTCVNCGKLRRPDMETCHRCGAKWLIPELTPPTWRVVNEKA
ncbi:MAG: hypothetical protein ACYTBV_17700 [Planctomycetota bacterium]